jgi:hypothetical protein
MIDLTRTKAQLLAEIQASAPAGPHWLRDTSDRGFHSLDQTFLALRGRTPRDLLPVLTVALSRRFSRLPPAQLSRDLLDPLKKSLGNAYKRGNLQDPAKLISVEAVMTPLGAVVSVSDEGEGFDVGSLHRKFQADEPYYEHHGSGFRHFEKARAVIGYADAGRTFLLRFLAEGKPGEAPASGEASLGKAGDVEVMKQLLARELRPFRDGKAALESCRVYARTDGPEDAVTVTYVLEYQKPGARKGTMTLSGRLLDPAAARATYSVAQQLDQGAFRNLQGVRVPKPLAVFDDPPIVLFKFQPSKDFGAYVREAGRRETSKAIAWVGEGLRALHRSGVRVATEESLDAAMERHRAVFQAVAVKLAEASPEEAERARRCFLRLAERAKALGPYEPATIHGSFSWDAILHDGTTFYLSLLDGCRRSHPGFDVGTFVADLLRCYVLRDKGDPRRYVAGRERFLTAYFGRDTVPWRAELDFFVACALLLRLGRLLKRAETRWEKKVDGILEQWERCVASGLST